MELSTYLVKRIKQYLQAQAVTDAQAQALLQDLATWEEAAQEAPPKPRIDAYTYED